MTNYGVLMEGRIEPEAARKDMPPPMGYPGYNSMENGGYNFTYQTPGVYTMTFSSIVGWIAPPTQIVDVVAGQVAACTGVYAAVDAGTRLTVNIEPSHLRDSVRWYIQGQSWSYRYESGRTLTHLAPGDYTIQFDGSSDYYAPANIHVTVATNAPVEVVGEYTEHAGFLVLVIQAPSCVSQPRWAIRDGTNALVWREDSYLPNIPAGTYRFTFSEPEVEGILAPADMDVVVEPDGRSECRVEYTLDPSYTPPPASLTCSLTPAAVAEGMRWGIRNGTNVVWYESGEVAGNLADGVSYVLTFSPGVDWRAPCDTVWQAPAWDGCSRQYGHYADYVYAPGSITVRFEPEAAAAVARWHMWNGIAQSNLEYQSGQTALYLHVSEVVDYMPYSYTVTIDSSSPDWAPEKTSYQVDLYRTNADVTLVVPFHQVPPIPQNGVLQMRPNPAYLRFNAQWAIRDDSTNLTWLGRNDQVENLAVGCYTVTFSSVYGYLTPPDQVAELPAGSSTNIVCPTYERDMTIPAQMTVNIHPPEAVADGARWVLINWSTTNDNEHIIYHDSGEIAAPPGGHYIEIGLLDSTNWAAPDDCGLVFIPAPDTNAVFVIDCVYTQQIARGGIECDITPKSSGLCLDGGGYNKWGLRAEGTNVIRSLYGSSFCELVPGVYTATFDRAYGWITPPDQVATVLPLQTTRISANYVLATGPVERISCVLTPSDVEQDGAWRVTGLLFGNRSGNTRNLPGPGTYEITFADAVGMNKPANRTVVVGPGQTVLVTGAYTRVPSVRILLPRTYSEFMESETIHFQAQTFLLNSNAIVEMEWFERLWNSCSSFGYGPAVDVQASHMPGYDGALNGRGDTASVYVEATDASGNTYTSQVVTIYLHADSNANGLADAWESQYWPNAPSNASRTAMAKTAGERNPYESGGGEFDWDEDGFDNYAEWLADTDPTDGQSYFVVESAMGAAGPELQWHACSNRAYNVYVTEDLHQSFRLLKTLTVDEEPGMHRYQPENQSDMQFYHVEMTR